MEYCTRKATGTSFTFKTPISVDEQPAFMYLATAALPAPPAYVTQSLKSDELVQFAPYQILIIEHGRNTVVRNER